MKFKYIFIMFVAAIGLLASCGDDKDLGYLGALQVSLSSLSIPQEGGQVTFEVNSADEWKFMTKDKKGVAKDSIPAWITSSCEGGSAGTTEVTFKADATKGANNSTFMLVSGSTIQYITVIQGVLNPPFSTCAQVLAGPDGDTYKVKGTMTKISNTTYGNWYINDGTGEVYVYGTLDANGSEQKFSSLKLEEGDEVTIQGPKTTYKGTVELVNVTVLSYTKSLIKVDSVKEAALPKTGGEFKVYLTVKGDGVTVDIPEADQGWITMTGMTTKGNNAVLTFKAGPNALGARTSTLSFTSTSGSQSSTVTTEISQEGSIVPLTIAEFNAAEKGTAQYRLTGVITKIKNATKPEFTLTDYSGSTTVYGLEGFADAGLKEGDIITVVGARGEYNSKPQTSGAKLEDSYKASDLEKVTVAGFLAKPESKDTYYRLSGTIVTSSESKTDLNTYGNFGLKDETGEVYVYGLLIAKDAEKKQFAKLGLKEGDKVTIIGYRTSYNGLNQVGGAFFYTKD